MIGVLNPIPILKGKISPEGKLAGRLSPLDTLKGALSYGMTDSYEHYEGQYTVTPSSSSDIILETADKVMDGNVTVREIPFYKTTNLSDGYTVYIGTEVI